MRNIEQIKGYPGYFVSDDGRVFSSRKRRRKSGSRGGTVAYISDELQEVKPKKEKNGYLRLALYKDGKQKHFSVHTLVLTTFVGDCPAKMQACHNDGNPENNSLSNLRWDTPKNNQKDRKRHGTTVQGEDVVHAKLTEKKVRIIKHALTFGVRGTQVQLAKIFGVDRNTIGRIAAGKLWKHVTI